MFSFEIDSEIKLILPQPHLAEELLELVRENLEILQPWMPWATDDYSIEKSHEFIKTILSRYAENGSFDAIISYQNKLVGAIGFHNFDVVNKSAEIGYWLAKNSQGKGIVTKCASGLCDFLFDDLDLNRVQINCNVENSKSRAIPEKLGFTLEGVHRQCEFQNGKFADWTIYAMLKQDWLEIKKNK